MPTRRRRNTRPLAAQAAELAFAVPQVVVHRVTRMALAGPMPSPRDRKEFHRMGAEKTAAFNESWQAMTAQAVRAQQELVVTMTRAFWSPWLRGKPAGLDIAAQLQRSALGVLDQGMGPVHRRAVANAKRLARTKLR